MVDNVHKYDKFSSSTMLLCWLQSVARFSYSGSQTTIQAKQYQVYPLQVRLVPSNFDSPSHTPLAIVRVRIRPVRPRRGTTRSISRVRVGVGVGVRAMRVRTRVGAIRSRIRASIDDDCGKGMKIE